MTPTDPEALQVAFRVLDALQKLGIPYHIGGSYASAIHGVPRQTHDVDLVVDLAPSQAQALVQQLSGDFYVDEQSVAQAAARHSSCNLVHLVTGVKVDLFVKGVSAFDREEFDRRVLVRLGENPPRDVFVKSAEDTVLRKLIWFQLGGGVSERQWQDVRGILSVQAGKLDERYLTRWAGSLGIRDLLDKVLAGG